jgi:hypothetical protein
LAFFRHNSRESGANPVRTPSLKQQICVDLSYRTTIRWLHELNFHLCLPRSWPKRQNEQERADFLERLRGWTSNPTVQLWFSDECGVEGDPRPRRR